MGSDTQTKKKKRLWKLTKEGKERKRSLRKGTTPRFPVHVEDDPTAELPQPPGSQPVGK